MPGVSTPPDELPQWELAFRFVSGRLCLAFCASVGERWRRNFERLRSPSDLGRWVVAAGLLPEPPGVDEAGLEAARELREAVYRAVRAAMARQDPDPADLETINACAAEADLPPQLGGDGTKRMRTPPDPVTATLSTIARDAIDLLSGPERERIRECEAPDCALLFVDRSRPGRRLWCADKACGNRSRVMAYRLRQNAVHDPSQRNPDTGRPS